MEFSINPEKIEKWSLEKHIGVTSKLIADGENMTVLWSRWEPGAKAPEHQHPHEQIGYCIEGEIIVSISGVDTLIKAGEFYHIPRNAAHAEWNDGKLCAILVDFFSPRREDLLNRRFDPQITQDD